MINLRRGIRYFVRGMGYGSIAYLAIIAFLSQNSSISTTNIITVFIISGLIGELSFLFQTKLSFSNALIIHLTGTFILFLGMMLINRWLFNWQTILIFIFVYIMIWIIIRLVEERQIHRINQQIKNRRK
ncbi:DUF3021 domain-containing protein [Limosilactobacillus gorillae]|uniref:DUF3021 domain-containing protein n=1 Tax=Limosilactobacillus gorillae TaxID=1450649 RepID=UPI000AF80695|nr:DUF3021 domain-containing protein [Limosilactobacillus gorillae]